MLVSLLAVFLQPACRDRARPREARPLVIVDASMQERWQAACNDGGLIATGRGSAVPGFLPKRVAALEVKQLDCFTRDSLEGPDGPIDGLGSIDVYWDASTGELLSLDLSLIGRSIDECIDRVHPYVDGMLEPAVIDTIADVIRGRADRKQLARKLPLYWVINAGPTNLGRIGDGVICQVSAALID